MAAPSEPKPAELPLPGGPEGPTVRLHPLLSGRASWPQAWPHGQASGMHQFPDATFGLTEDEWDAANGPLSVLHGYVKDHFRRALEYRTLDFESRASDSYSTFGRSLDLLGDGSMRAVFTPGHT